MGDLYRPELEEGKNLAGRDKEVIEYHCVIDDKGYQVFGEVPNEVYMWLFSPRQRRELSRFTVLKRPSMEKESAEDYLFKVV